MRKAITERDRDALDVIKRLRFATREQIAYWINETPITAFRIIKALMARSLVRVYSDQKPHIYRLSDSGAAITGADYQQRWHSGSAMHQYLMRNQFEINYRKNTDPDFKMVDRLRLKSFGLNCQVGEHPARLNSELVLVIIDDYLMRPSRVNVVLDRPHETKNNAQYHERIKATGKVVIPTWRNAIKRIIVVTTYEQQLPVYKRSFSRKPLNMDYELLSIKPLWSIA